jgi:hypothetical protein
VDLQGGNLTGTEWWVWHIYYNSDLSGDLAEVNSVYQIHNVRENSMGTYKVKYNAVGQNEDHICHAAMTNCSCKNLAASCRYPHFHDPPTYPNWWWSGVYIDYSMDDDSGVEPTRERIVYTGVSGTFVPGEAHNEMHDASMGCKANSSLTWTDSEQLPRGFQTFLSMGDGMIPTDLIVSYGDDTVPADTGDGPEADDGYPFTVDQTWKIWQWQFSDGNHISGGDVIQEKGFKFTVSQTIDDYDVDAQSLASDTTTDTFDVYDITRKNNFWMSCTQTGQMPNGQNNSPASGTTHFYWNDSVKNYVHLYDVDTYAGREDWGIKAWESRRVKVTINDFSDAGTGFDISVTVENNCQTCEAGNFGVLALIMDMDALAPEDNVPYINGKTIYPSLDVGWSGTGGIAEAIKYTGTLQPGESTTLTWSNVGTSGSNTYKLWVNGATDTIN